MYREAQWIVKSNDTLTAPLKNARGVRQGDPLSQAHCSRLPLNPSF
jgi:hypothetical protein